MSKCCFKFNATSIIQEENVTTIMIADNAFSELITMCDGVPVSICINVSFPTDRECTSIVVTDGTTELPIFKRNQYWRPRKLICNSVLHTEFKQTPQLLVFKGGECFG